MVWLEITKNADCRFKNKLVVSFITIFGAFSFPILFCFIQLEEHAIGCSACGLWRRSCLRPASWKVCGSAPRTRRCSVETRRRRNAAAQRRTPRPPSRFSTQSQQQARVIWEQAASQEGRILMAENSKI